MAGGVPHRGGLPVQLGRVTRLGGERFLYLFQFHVNTQGGIIRGNRVSGGSYYSYKLSKNSKQNDFSLLSTWLVFSQVLSRRYHNFYGLMDENLSRDGIENAYPGVYLSPRGLQDYM